MFQDRVATKTGQGHTADGGVDLVADIDVQGNMSKQKENKEKETV